MAQKNMPGTSKQRSVSRPAQGKGRRPVVPGKPSGQRPLLATPRARAAVVRRGSLDGS